MEKELTARQAERWAMFVRDEIVLPVQELDDICEILRYYRTKDLDSTKYLQ